MSRLLPRLTLGTLLILALAACGAAAAPAPAARSISLEPCRLSEPGIMGRTIAAECGTLAVPEDHAAAAGRTIALRVVVLPAISRDAAAPPLFLLAGGPGQAASDAFAPLIPSLARANQSRDLVLVDQRGTGGSHPLSCPLEAEGLDAASVDPESPEVQAWWRDCLASLDADPTQYTTAAAARDLDAVRAAMGYEQLNLLGVSYGTRLALAYLQLFPERVRSLVLDGVVPPDLAIGAAMARDGQRALDMALAACAADAACATAFPDPRGDLDALLERLGAEPPLVQLDDPFTGAPAEVRLTRELAAATIFGMSYAPETTALLPLLIHTAQREGDLRPLAAQTLITSRQLADQIAVGLRSSVICTEDAPRFTAATTAAGYLGDLMPRALASACSVWPRGETVEQLRAPVASAVPALLLSGERDPVTPPAYGEAVAAGLPNSLHIVAPGQGHNVFFRGCLPSLVAEFLDAGTPAGLDPSCVERLAAPPFFTSFTGPQP